MAKRGSMSRRRFKRRTNMKGGNGEGEDAPAYTDPSERTTWAVWDGSRWNPAPHWILSNQLNLDCHSKGDCVGKECKDLPPLPNGKSYDGRGGWGKIVTYDKTTGKGKVIFHNEKKTFARFELGKLPSGGNTSNTGNNMGPGTGTGEDAPAYIGTSERTTWAVWVGKWIDPPNKVLSNQLNQDWRRKRM
jgi:hypothetical protein